MTTITSLGIGSGIDINAIVSDIVAAEAESPGLRLAQQEVEAQAEISALGLLKSALTEFQSALDALNDPSQFQSRLATSGNESLFTATADSSAVTGNYDIEVVSLAEAHKISSLGYADADTSLGSGGTLTISTEASAFEVVIDDANATVAEIRDAINEAQDNTGVTASVVNVDDGVGGTESRLVLTATGTGSESAITVTVDDNDGMDTDTAGLSALVYDPAGLGVTNMSELQSAQDAQIKVDGLTVTQSTNTISDAIEGLAIHLVEASPGESVTLAVALDETSVKVAIEGFVASYNSMMATINSLSAFDPVTGEAGLLLGDATLRGVTSAIQRELGTEVDAVTGTYSTLASVGILTELDGTLSLDSATLNEALDTSFEDLNQLFASEDGVAVRLDAAIDPYVQTAGNIDSKTDSLHVEIEDINEEVEDLELHLASLESRLLEQYIAMDAIVANLLATSDFLNQQFSMLDGLFQQPSSSF